MSTTADGARSYATTFPKTEARLSVEQPLPPHRELGRHPFITMYINGVQVLQVEDRGVFKFSDGKSYGPWPTGAPGIGFYRQCDSTTVRCLQRPLGLHNGLYDDVDNEWSAFGISAFSATGR
ncbi:MAG: hypothetical protein AAB152_06230 [Candidatus Coatesbacteria bacterium]